MTLPSEPDCFDNRVAARAPLAPVSFNEPIGNEHDKRVDFDVPLALCDPLPEGKRSTTPVSLKRFVGSYANFWVDGSSVLVAFVAVVVGPPPRQPAFLSRFTVTIEVTHDTIPPSHRVHM
jgi:hypothetical protein